VSAVVRRILRGRGQPAGSAEVDDITENVFVALLERDAALLRRYDPAHPLRTYVAVVARTAAHRWLRRRRPQADLPDGAWRDGLANPARTPHPEATSRREVHQLVRGELEALGPRDRDVLERFYYEGQSYGAIAEALGLSVNSVGATLTRARARLARALREHHDLTESDWRSV